MDCGENRSGSFLIGHIQVVPIRRSDNTLASEASHQVDAHQIGGITGSRLATDLLRASRLAEQTVLEDKYLVPKKECLSGIVGDYEPGPGKTGQVTCQGPSGFCPGRHIQCG